MLKSAARRLRRAAGRYDELLGVAARAAPALGRVPARAGGARARASVGDTLSLMEREIRENGVTYNVYADPQGADRPWELDPLPLLLSAERVAADRGRHRAARRPAQPRAGRPLRPAGRCCASGAVPPALVFGHRGFLRPAHGIRPPGGVHLFHYAADLARSPDGHWWVLSDRTQAPSGAGYALENRLVVSRVFPQLFRDLHVQHLAPFFAALRESLLRWAPRGDGGRRWSCCSRRARTTRPTSSTRSSRATSASRSSRAAT